MKRILAIILCAAMLLSLVACASDKDSSTAGDDTTVDLSQYATEYPVDLSDTFGNEIKLEKAPEKIVSTDSAFTSLCIALGLEEKLVAVEADAADGAIYSLAAKDVAELPSAVGEDGFDVEKCADLGADLVLLTAEYASYAEALEQKGIKALAFDMNKDGAVNSAVIAVSKATDSYYKCVKWFELITDQKGTIDSRMEKASHVRVYVAGGDSVLCAAGADVALSRQVDAVNGTVFGVDLEGWTEVAYGDITDWQPQCIVIASDASYTVEDVLNDESLSNCTAVKNKAVYKMPADIEAWDKGDLMSSFLGMHWLAYNIHPNNYTNIEYNSYAKAFYKEYFGFEPESK